MECECRLVVRFSLGPELLHELLICSILAMCECFALIEQNHFLQDPQTPEVQAEKPLLYFFWSHSSTVDSCREVPKLASSAYEGFYEDQSKMSTNIDRSLGRYIVIDI